MKIQKFTTPNQSNRGSYKPLYIVWHIAEGTYNGTVTWEQNPQSQTSSHFVLGKGGEVAQLVPLDMAAWTQGVVKSPTHAYVKAHSGVNPNLYCISIECEGKWNETKGKLTDKQLAAAAELTRHIVSEVKRIYGTTISIDREHMIGHCEINTVTRPHCPGELFPYDELISLAKSDKPPEKPTVAVNPSYQYTVQVGAFQTMASALPLHDKLAKLGYFTFYDKTDMVKVCVGKFKDKPTAQRTADDLQKKGFSCYVKQI